MLCAFVVRWKYWIIQQNLIGDVKIWINILKIQKDVVVILAISFISAVLYIAFEGSIMDYGKDLSHPLLLRFLPVFLIQFGMSCLGILIVLLKNKENSQNMVWLKEYFTINYWLHISSNPNDYFPFCNKWYSWFFTISRNVFDTQYIKCHCSI